MIKKVFASVSVALACTAFAASQPASAIEAPFTNVPKLILIGANNRVDVQQANSAVEASLGNRVNITIQGDRNGRGTFPASLQPLGLTPGRITQIGSGNSLTASILGSDNLFAYSQHGVGNVIFAAVQGNGNSSAVMQVGNSHTAVYSQIGNGNSLSIVQRSR